MKPRVLLVNPPIYDFTAYDFWLKPYGLLAVAGFLRGQADFSLFDYLDRCHPAQQESQDQHNDPWLRGPFRQELLDKPACLSEIPRRYRRFGLARSLFQQFLSQHGPFDIALIQSMMTYWYPGVQEIIADLRQYCSLARIVLGGPYATLCPKHAQSLEVDLLINGMDLKPLWKLVGIQPDITQPALWEAYPQLKVGVLKLTQGCPFRCSYCSVSQVYGSFQPRDMSRSRQEVTLLEQRGVTQIAFYDDALLFKADQVLLPFLENVMAAGASINLHSPNALNARFLTRNVAQKMVAAGFKTFYLGFESAAAAWQQRTGDKVTTNDLIQAVTALKEAKVPSTCITAYQILGHPHQDLQQLETSMHSVRSLGIRGMLADFSPIPGTPDGDRCRSWVDMDEPLMHNKTAFPILRLGFDEVNRLKNLQKKLNQSIKD